LKFGPDDELGAWGTIGGAGVAERRKETRPATINGNKEKERVVVAHCALASLLFYSYNNQCLVDHFLYPTTHKVSHRALVASQSLMDTHQALRSPIILDGESSFDKNGFSDIQTWLSGIMSITEEEYRLQSPICLPEYPCASISRKRRGDPRPSRSKRRCLAWGLPAEHRFFDKANWMDEADKRVASIPQEEQCAWRDAYSVMISQPRSRQRTHIRRQRRLESSPCFSPYNTIALPVCPPLDPSSPHTPTRRAPSRFVYVDRSATRSRPPALAMS